MTPTYDQLVAEAQKRGVTMSDYDLAFARENPTAGFGILNAKTDYMNASTPEAKALANAAAEQWRSQGGYSGGADGSQFVPVQSSVSGLTQQITQYPSFQYGAAPSFNDSYKQQYDANLNALLNFKDFSYDATKDPLYQQYAQTYRREGDRATENTLAQLAANTGGLASSYAASAAAQAGNYYAQQLADKIPELYQQAYQQYADQYNRQNNNVGNLLNARNFDLGVYDAQLGQYNTDRNMAYQQYSDEYSRLGDALALMQSQEKASGRGSGTPAADETANPVSDALLGQLLNLSGTEAANALTTYYDRLTESQRNILARRAGLDPLTVKKGIGNAEDTAALLGMNGLLGGNEKKTVADYATANTYNEAFNYLVKNGYDYSDVLTEDQFNKEKNSEVLSESEFNRSSAMLNAYGTYDMYKATANRYKQFSDYYSYLQAIIGAKVSGAY